jgi:transposase
MATAHVMNSSPVPTPTLYLAVELSWGQWKLAFSTGIAQKPRLRNVSARAVAALELEIAEAKKRFHLPANTPVVACYEAGRDGFWLCRCLRSRGVETIVVDAASIEVNRRKRRAKTDRLDAAKLVTMLIRWHNGEQKLWSIVQVPSEDDEDRRQLHREMIGLTDERTAHINRIKGLLAGIGVAVAVDLRLPERLDGLRQWDDKPIPSELRARILRECERFQVVEKQIRLLESEQRQRVRNDQTPEVDRIRRLLSLKGVGVKGAWLLMQEVFSWRSIRNRRHLASLAGLAPTPYGSGQMDREQGISKAGNKRLRWLMVQLAWFWLRNQPQSELSQWYERRFAKGSGRMRKCGIVAVARKLLVALWRYATQGELPAGANEVPWQQKLGGAVSARYRVAG